MATKPTKATITFDNDKPPVELPILSGSMGNDVIDIRTLGHHDIYTYDPGFYLLLLATPISLLLMVKKVFFIIVVIQSNNLLSVVIFRSSISID